MYIFVLTKRLSTSLGVVVRDAFHPLMATLAMAVVVLAVLHRLPPWNPVLQLAILVLCGALSFSVVLGATSGRRLRQDLRWLLRARADATPEIP